MSVIDKAVATAKGIDATPVMDKLEKWTMAMIDAATPVAKQAYEIGLLTLRVDAAQSLIFSFLGVLTILAVIYFQKRILKWDKAREIDSSDMPMYLPSGVTFLGALFVIAIIYDKAARPFFDIWNWIKLFCPDLWLAHTAIQKIFN